MAQVLAVVPQAGLEAVLVVIELVLEGRAPKWQYQRGARAQRAGPLEQTGHAGAGADVLATHPGAQG